MDSQVEASLQVEEQEQALLKTWMASSRRALRGFGYLHIILERGHGAVGTGWVAVETSPGGG